MESAAQAQLPLIEPLSVATETVIKPLQLNKADRLLIGTKDERNFLLTPVPVHVKEEAQQATLLDLLAQDTEFKKVPLARGRSAQVSCDGRRICSEDARAFRYILEGHAGPNRSFGSSMFESKVAAATDLTVIAIHESWGIDRLLFEDDEAELRFKLIIARFRAQHIRARIIADFKINKLVPDLGPTYVEDEKRPLSDYQKVALKISLGQEATALFMDRGTGKTPVVVRRVSMEAQAGDKPFRVLVVVPRQARSNWYREFHDFSTVPGKVTIIRGGQLKRLKLLTESMRLERGIKFYAVVVGYDSYVKDSKIISKIPWDLVVCDESHHFKNHQSKRFGALKSLRETTRYRMILTGTPIGNVPWDVHPQLEFLGEGLSGFIDQKKFRQCFGVFSKVEDATVYGVERLQSLRNIPLLHERLSRMSFQITKKEAGLNLPDKIYDIYDIEMTEIQAKIYKDVAAKLLVELKDIIETSKSSLVVENVLTKLLRLAQVTSGFLKVDPLIDEDTGDLISPGRIERIPGPNPKIEALRELVDQDRSEDPNSKMIVWAVFIEDMKAIGELLTSMGVKHGLYYGATKEAARDDLVDAFNNDPEFKVLVANPQTAAEALNLIGYDKNRPEESTTYCDHEVFFSCNWSFLQRSQAEDRAHRRGTRMPVRITDLMAPLTIDEEIRDRVKQKELMAENMLDVRNILANITRSIGEI